MIEVRDLSFGYSKHKPVLKGISFNAKRGEVINILGPNGCGKSTLLKLILGFLPISKGSVTIDGKDIREIGRKKISTLLSYVPQLHSGAFSYKVIDVVLMGRYSQRSTFKYSAKDYEIANEALERINLGTFAERSYLELSGGERQLVLIARALAQKADYFIMDEPVTGLDYGNQFRLLQTVKSLAEEGLTVILTTHHPEHAVFLGGRALLIKEGQVMADGEPYRVITTNCICSLYNMPRELVEKFSDMHYARRSGQPM